MTVAIPAALRSARHIRPTMTAGICDPALGFIRRLRQRSGFAFPSRARPTREFAPLPVTTHPVFRRRDMRVDRRLARFAYECFELYDPSDQPLDHVLLLR
jgi:hypothetical protein